MKKKRNFLKWLLIIFFIIFVPIFTVIITLYSNDAHYLKKFQVWINKPGNLSAFIVICMSYLPLINFFWALILNIYKSKITKLSLQKFKLEEQTIIIHHDKKSSVLYNPKTKKLEASFIDSSINPKLSTLADQLYVELKERIKAYEKSKG